MTGPKVSCKASERAVVDGELDCPGDVELALPEVVALLVGLALFVRFVADVLQAFAVDAATQEARLAL